MIRGWRAITCGGLETGLLPWSDVSNSTPNGSGVGGGGANGPGTPPESGNLLTHRWGSLIATNLGIVYGVPYDASPVLKMVFSGGNLQGLGMIGDPMPSQYGFYGACRASGGKVFSVGSGKLLTIDPSNDVVTLTDVAVTGSPPMMVAADGNPMFVAADGNGDRRVYKIDQNTLALTSIVITNMPDISAWNYLRHPNGNIYMATDVGMVKVDPATGVATYDFPFPYPMNGPMCLTADGTIVCARGGQCNVPTTRAMFYNPAWSPDPDVGVVWPQQLSFVYDAASGTNEYFSSVVLSPTGNVFMIPNTHDNVVEINPSTRAFHIYDAGANMIGASWGGSVVGYDGRIYAAPMNQTGVFYINNNAAVPFANWVMNPFTDRF